MPYFGEPVGRVKIQTTSKNSQRYYTTKRLIRDLLSNTPNCYVRGGENFANIYLRGMRDRSMRSGTKLAREIQLTDWSTAGNLSNRSSGANVLVLGVMQLDNYVFPWFAVPYLETECCPGNSGKSIKSGSELRSFRRFLLVTYDFISFHVRCH